MADSNADKPSGVSTVVGLREPVEWRPSKAFAGNHGTVTATLGSSYVSVIVYNPEHARALAAALTEVADALDAEALTQAGIDHGTDDPTR